MKKHVAAWIVLLVITMVAGFCLALTNENTRDVIAKQEEQKAEDARGKLIPGAVFEKQEISESSGLLSLYAGKKDGETVGYVAVVAVNGFGGPVEVTVGLDAEAKIQGIFVGGAQFAETAGLGAKAKEAKFTDQYKDRVAPLKVIKAGEEAGNNTIDAITAATITSSAVNGGVNKAANFLKEMLGLNEEEEMTAGSKTATASADGFGGPVAVTLTLADDGTIAEFVIGDDNFNETEGFGAKALAPDFAAQFIGKKLPITLSDIDSISGATITSTAVVDAANKAYEKIMNAGAKASADGFGGPVAVTLTLAEDGTIGSVVIGDSNFAETEGYGAKALAPEFAAQFAGKSLPLTIDQIDAIAGATITSKAVVAAINKAYDKLTNAAETMAAAEPTAEPTAAPAPMEGEIVTGSAQGFGGPVAVELTITKDGLIGNLKIGDDSFNETQGFGAKALEPGFAAQFIGKALPIEISDIDAIAGATITSEAVISAVNKAYEAYKNPAAAEPTAEPTAAPAPMEGEVVTGSAQGFGGPVTVELTITKDGLIGNLKIGDDSFNETQGFGAKALEPGFAAQFIGKALPIEISDIDAIAGATITSEAVISAVNKAYEEFTAAMKPEELANGTTGKASAKGYAGSVAVEVTIDEAHKITALKIGDESFKESEGFGAKALDESFAAQFIGLSLPVSASDITVISGATITTKAVIDAINSAFDKQYTPASAEKAEPQATAAPEAAQTSEPQAPANGAAGKASVKGYSGSVAVEVTIDEAHKITALKIGDESFKESQGFGAKALDESFAAQFIGLSLPVAASDIAVISGATVTTQAVIDAINSAFDKNYEPVYDVK